MAGGAFVAVNGSLLRVQGLFSIKNERDLSKTHEERSNERIISF